MLLIDTHLHLYAEEFDEDRKQVIDDALTAGIGQLLLPNIDSTTIESMMSLARQYPDVCFPMMGLHPCSVGSNYQQELQVVEYWLNKRKFVAIGEIGIDLYWDKTFIAQQQEAFRMQIQLAKKYDLPYVIHARNSFDEVMEIVTEFKNDPLRAIFHCFSGTVAQAEEVVAMKNFKLGIGGVVTFKNSGLDKVVEAIDLKNLVLETDAPYLAPVPFRGKTNHPEYLVLIAK